MRGTSSTDGFDTKMRSSNNGTPLESESNNNPFSPTTATDTPYYIELKRVSADLIEFRAFSDSNYSTQVGSTVTRATTSAVTALRYITINLVAQGAIGGDGYTGYIQNLKFFNATTTATEAEKATITDVPTGTRFEETDTRKIFRRKGATTLTFGDDFTSSGSTSHTSNNSTVGDWTTNDYADVKVDGTNDYLSFSIHENATSERISYDLQNSNALGSGNNASSNFVCRGEIYWSSITISNNLLMYIEVSDVGYSASTQTNLVGIGFYPYGGYIRVREATSGTAQNDVQPSFTHSTSTTFFWEIIKNGTAYTCTIRSGSHTGTTLATGTGATGDHTNLRYIRIRNRGGDNESGVFNGYIDNIKFYNGVTSVDTASWVEKGTA